MNGAVCECDIGLLFLILVILSYHGDTCSESCEGLREEDGEVYECSGYGDCELTDGKYECKCDDYAFGPDCSQVCPESYRDEDDNVIICSGYGTCSFDGTAKCVCTTGYYGEDCSDTCTHIEYEPGFHMSWDIEDLIFYGFIKDSEDYDD